MKIYLLLINGLLDTIYATIDIVIDGDLVCSAGTVLYAWETLQLFIENCQPPIQIFSDGYESTL